MKAFLEEPGSEVLGDLADHGPWATCRLSFVECHAAFARGAREGRLTRAEGSRAARELDRRWNDLVVVELDAAVAQHAAALTRRHPLRSADAIHLAAAHVLVEDPDALAFVCWDRRLRDAARDVGFRAVPESSPP